MMTNYYTENFRVDYIDAPFIDYPTAFWLTEQEGYAHADEKCSAVQTDGALLCDCDALNQAWERLNRPRVCGVSEKRTIITKGENGDQN